MKYQWLEELTSKERVMLTMWRMQMNEKSWADPDTAERYFRERSEYILDGIDRMTSEDIVWGGGQTARCLFMIRALLLHHTDTKEAYLEHILDERQLLMLKSESTELTDALLDSSGLVIGSVSDTLLSDNEPFVRMKHDIERSFDFSKRTPEEVYQRLEEEIWKKIRAELDTITKNEAIHVGSWEKLKEVPPKDLLIRMITAEMESLIHVPASRTPIGGYMDGYQEFMAATFLSACFNMSMNQEHLLLPFQELLSAKNARARQELETVLDDFVQHQVLGALKEKTVILRCNQLDDAVSSAVRIMQDPGADIDTILPSPFTARQLIRNKPEGYYCRGAYEAVLLHMIRKESTECWKQTMRSRIAAGLSGDALADTAAVNRMRAERDDARRTAQRTQERADRQEEVIRKLNRLLKERDAELQALKSNNGNAREIPESSETQSVFEEELLLMEEHLAELETEKQALAARAADETARADRMEAAWRAEQERVGKERLLVYGEEQDLYPEEIRMVLNDTLEEALKGQREGTRRHDILCSILNANRVTGSLQERQDKVKQIFRESADDSDRLASKLKEVGIERVSTSGKHAKYIYYGDSRYQTTIAKTASDYRAGANNAHVIIESML